MEVIQGPEGKGLQTPPPPSLSVLLFLFILLFSLSPLLGSQRGTLDLVLRPQQTPINPPFTPSRARKLWEVPVGASWKGPLLSWTP